ncbi:hypothetical protein JTE90_017301 [Oedothorax gibbosus]|uniref:Uncharacterized protein n=1 Tax=Oedothorax gibbosus TaxID=931172 RepID=A0AAV6TTK9_9ARAC|nr:hypothetical protein JTE90_017301 [Oedothorax gibbosus]
MDESKAGFKVEEEGKAYELRRRQWIESKRERLETRNGRKTGENHETVSNIYTEQENSMQRQYRQQDSTQYVHTNLQVYPQDYIQRAHAKGNMGISYQRSHSNNDILYTNAVVHRESEESINDADKDKNNETYAKRMYHDPKETHDTSLDLQISSVSNDDFYYTTMPSGIDVRHARELGRNNTEVESKVWKKHNDAKYYKKYKSSQMLNNSDSFQGNIKPYRVSHENSKDVVIAESKQNKFSTSNDESYENVKVAQNINNKDYELRSGKDIKKLGYIQHKTSENTGMKNNEAYKDDEILL